MKTLIEKLKTIQYELNAPKDEYNKHGNYAYRSAESILIALKPHLWKHGLVLTLSDDVVAVGEAGSYNAGTAGSITTPRIYVKATATLGDGEHSISTSALAREPIIRKGMDESQRTGAASSYARKYALCGLFAIDDNKDADATNTHDKEPPPPAPLDTDKAIAALKSADNLDTLKKYFSAAYKRATEEQKGRLKEVYDQRKADFEAAEEGNPQ